MLAPGICLASKQQTAAAPLSLRPRLPERSASALVPLIQALLPLASRPLHMLFPLPDAHFLLILQDLQTVNFPELLLCPGPMLDTTRGRAEWESVPA